MPQVLENRFRGFRSNSIQHVACILACWALAVPMAAYCTRTDSPLPAILYYDVYGEHHTFATTSGSAAIVLEPKLREQSATLVENPRLFQERRLWWRCVWIDRVSWKPITCEIESVIYPCTCALIERNGKQGGNGSRWSACWAFRKARAATARISLKSWIDLIFGMNQMVLKPSTFRR